MYRDDAIEKLETARKKLQYVEERLSQPLEIWERAEYAQVAADLKSEIAKREKHISHMDDMYPGGIVGSW